MSIIVPIGEVQNLRQTDKNTWFGVSRNTKDFWNSLNRYKGQLGQPACNNIWNNPDGDGLCQEYVTDTNTGYVPIKSAPLCPPHLFKNLDGECVNPNELTREQLLIAYNNGTLPQNFHYLIDRGNFTPIVRGNLKRKVHNGKSYILINGSWVLDSTADTTPIKTPDTTPVKTEKPKDDDDLIFGFSTKTVLIVGGIGAALFFMSQMGESKK